MRGGCRAGKIACEDAQICLRRFLQVLHEIRKCHLNISLRCLECPGNVVWIKAHVYKLRLLPREIHLSHYGGFRLPGIRKIFPVPPCFSLEWMFHGNFSLLTCSSSSFNELIEKVAREGSPSLCRCCFDPSTFCQGTWITVPVQLRTDGDSFRMDGESQCSGNGLGP